MVRDGSIFDLLILKSYNEVSKGRKPGLTLLFPIRVLFTKFGRGYFTNTDCNTSRFTAELLLLVWAKIDYDFIPWRDDI